MTDIPFEKISVEEAHNSTWQELPPPKVLDKNWGAHRFPLSQDKPDIKQLMPWVQQLPPEVRPRQLVIQYARIANKLAELWKHPIACEKYFNALMIDDRGDRQGFPADVALELAALQAYFTTHVLVQHYSVWGDRIG
ncbi:hypothetical protein [Noviherbaspirillum sedimenti]|uniref:Uncharacterized protein n=1 Tax=Noviherbaspirillum sedimenti TaxID=2320865 RepID=A0A3A3FZ44_9BURK|nr:hypothetical protein [Noviherbaspirillum sedimenti]RJG00911.1 hypothetical protein D3878_04350 [Noviherbaspirillum sedimenti]